MSEKNKSSVDGFIVHPRRQNTKQPDAVDDNIQVKHQLPERQVDQLTGKDLDFDDKLADDISESLADIEAQSDSQSDTDDYSAQPRRSARHRSAKRKWIKRTIIIIIIALLMVAGYFGAKIMMAGGKVFKGSFLSVLTTKKPLKQDKNGRTNILIFGTSGYKMQGSKWDGASLTDSIMVMSLDQNKKDAYMMSLPRDLYVKYNTSTGASTKGKLNEIYTRNNPNEKNEAAGAKALMNKAGEIFGLDIHYYVHADWAALTQIVDAVGGVDVKIETTDKRGIYDSGTKIKYKNGEIAHLNGQKALALARARNHNRGDYGLASGNYAREQNQQRIIQAIQRKVLSTGTLLNIVAVNNLIDAIGNNLITDFDAANVQTLVDVLKDLKPDRLHRLPLTSRPDKGPDLVASYSEGGVYRGEAPTAGVFDYSAIQSYVRTNLMGSNDTNESATIDVLNGSTKAGLAAEKAKQLKEAKFTVGKVGNAPTKTQTDEVVVYQLNSQKTSTAQSLAQYYHVNVVTSPLKGYDTTADFVVVFGSSAKLDN